MGPSNRNSPIVLKFPYINVQETASPAFIMTTIIAYDTEGTDDLVVEIAGAVFTVEDYCITLNEVVHDFPTISPDRMTTQIKKAEHFVKKSIHGISVSDRYPKRRESYYIRRDFKSMWCKYNYPSIVTNGVSNMDLAALGAEYHIVNFPLLKWKSRIYDPLHMLIKTLQFR